MTRDRVLFEYDDGRGIATLTLNDPNRYNPFSEELVEELAVHSTRPRTRRRGVSWWRAPGRRSPPAATSN